MSYRSRISGLVCFALLCMGHGTFVRAAEQAPQARVAAGIGTADKVLDLLDYLVVKLANKQDTWKKLIQPNLEIFLIGVSTDQPVRFDMVFDEKNGMQTQAIIPITDMKDFIENNLIPIGIDVTQDKKDRTLYELTGQVYEGWMRYLSKAPAYAVFFGQKEALPADLAHPSEVHKTFTDREAIAFVAIDNDEEHVKERAAAFQIYRDKAAEKFKKLSTETKEEFEFRKQSRSQLMNLLQLWVSEIDTAELVATLDKSKGELPASSSLTAIPGTSLAQDLAALKANGSRFSGIEVPADAILSVRVNLPVNQGQIEGAKKTYSMMLPMLRNRIAKATKPTDAEKVAIEEIATTLVDVLTENLTSQKSLDGFLDVYPSGDKHTIIMGVSATGGAKFNEMLAKVPGAQSGWAVEFNKEKVRETNIHRVTFGKTPPKSLSDFYGGSNEAWIAVSDNSVWLAGGAGSLEALKSAIEKAAEVSPANGVLATVKLRGYRVLQNIDAMQNDPDLELLNQINIKGRRKERVETRKAAEPTGNRPGDKAGSNLASFVWVPTALTALQGQPDELTLEIKLNDKDELIGSSNAQSGILKAFGALVAKFAEENLK
ncbi:hypothetical protein SH668x_002834 [Planctomicrobium sp. SH668]|uniref:hypothetical protein n=1 Tax=Planctomicrobium sp. SH668 TaxID=3448126 RepID=UPI003F5B0475